MLYIVQAIQHTHSPACLQVDRVEVFTWQAQLSGTKVWTLTPPPECEHMCQAFNVTVNKGDISELIIIPYINCMIIYIANNLFSQLLTVKSACS